MFFYGRTPLVLEQYYYNKKRDAEASQKQEKITSRILAHDLSIKKADVTLLTGKRRMLILLSI